MEKIRASNANSTSPYAQPLYNLNPSLAKRARIRASSLSNCLRGKKGKIRLKFKLDDMKKKSMDAKAAEQISVSFDQIFTCLESPHHEMRLFSIVVVCLMVNLQFRLLKVAFYVVWIV